MDRGSPRRDDSDRDDRGVPDATSWVRTSALGLQVVLTFIALAWLGTWIDGRYGSRPWGVLAGSVLGFIAVFVTLLREGGTPRSRRRDPREEREAAGSGDGGPTDPD